MEDRQLRAWMEDILRRLADLEMATGMERVLHRAVKEVAEDYVHRRRYGDEPSLGSVMARISQHARVYGKPGKPDWDQGYARAMNVVHEWLADLLRRTEQ